MPSNQKNWRKYINSRHKHLLGQIQWYKHKEYEDKKIIVNIIYGCGHNIKTSLESTKKRSDGGRN